VDIACALMIDAVFDGLVIPPECLQKLDDFRGFLISKNGQRQRKLFAKTRQFIVPALSGENADRHVQGRQAYRSLEPRERRSVELLVNNRKQ
jgi:hypothetical protein